MKVCGIVSEYNPFHNGHRYHIQKTKKRSHCDVLINVMSGHFVQRGEAAIADKWSRAETAVKEGCDIVIELPYPYALQSADGFAYGAINSLKLAGVDCIVFGSETNDLTSLQQLADSKVLKDPTRSLASSSNVNSNDILGIAYLKALKHTDIVPYTIQRTNGYHDMNASGSIASATTIRHHFYQQEPIEQWTPMSAQLSQSFHMEHYYPYVQMLLFTTDPCSLSHIFLMDEGIENKMIASAKTCTTMKEFVDSCISKRYTRARIQRTIIHLLTQTTKKDINELPEMSHIRILATNQTGRAYLKELKKQEVLIASRFNQIPKPYRNIDLKVASAYGIPLSPNERLALLKKEIQPPLQVEV